MSENRVLEGTGKSDSVFRKMGVVDVIRNLTRFLVKADSFFGVFLSFPTLLTMCIHMYIGVKKDKIMCLKNYEVKTLHKVAEEIKASHCQKFECTTCRMVLCLFEKYLQFLELQVFYAALSLHQS